MGNKKHRHDYSDKQALRIYDESVRFGRDVRKIVLSSSVVVVGGAAFFGLFMLTQVLQRGHSRAVTSAELVMVPATGQLLSTAFGALLAVILAVWFSPNSFRLGRSESPATIARELSTQRNVAFIARMCTFLALGVGLWGFISSIASSGPVHVDIVRTIAPVLLGLGLAWWAAAAEVRVGVTPSGQLLRAQHRREAKRLRKVLKRESQLELTRRGRFAQCVLAFFVIPLVAWGVGVWLVPPPSWGTGVARLVTAAVVSLVGYRALVAFLYFVIGRQVAAAAGFMGMVGFVGLTFSVTALAATLPLSATENTTPLGPLSQSVLLFSVITLSGPVVLLAALTSQRLFPQRPGLIYDSVMRRYRRELMKAVERSSSPGKPRGTRPTDLKRKKPFPSAAVASLVPIIPFNFMFAAVALRYSESTRPNGKGLAITGIIVGVITTLIVVGVIGYAATVNPTLVYCKQDTTAVCLDLS